jgi:hypothetical protein
VLRRLLLALVLASGADVARSEEVDGSYGRVEGDLLFDGSVGASLGASGFGLETHVSLLYLSSVGLYARYMEQLGKDDAPFDRLFGVGVELRPLFLGRYALDLERGPAFLDLFVDSFAFVLGATFRDENPGALEGMPGLEVGLSIEFPLLPRASGPYVGFLGLLQYGHDDLVGLRDRDVLERGSALVFTFSWHQIFDAGLVDLHDTLAD